MIVTPIPFDLDLAQSAQGYIRSDGLHMSAIYNDLYKDLEPKRYGQPMDPALQAGYMGVGMAFEEMLEEALRSRLTADSGRPGEFTEPEHGIIYSPDLIIFNGSTRLGEIKLTWASSREMPREVANGLPPKFDKWATQMKSYCRCLETPYARLYALFVNGPYDKSKGLKPEPLAWDITFTKRELDENWAMLVSHAKHKGLL